jgi:thiamine kinase-like enzyme
MQISHGNRILAYCKFSDKEEINALFLHEQTVLNRLKEKRIESIPESLYCGMLSDTVYLFVQSTVKTKRSRVLHQWTDLHRQFLHELKQNTEQKIPFEETDFLYSIQLLQRNLSYISAANRESVAKAIAKVLNYYKGKVVCFSAYHGDFTPWNMFEENKQLYVFDWEYARLTSPVYLDWFHFFTQCAIFEQHLQAEEILHLYTQRKNELPDSVEDADFYYTCYLLDIVSRYANRDRGIYDQSMANSMAVWTKLIEKFND